MEEVKKRERGGSKTNNKHMRDIKNDLTAGWLQVSASGLYSKLSTEAAMFTQAALRSLSSPACVSLTLGYSGDSTSTPPAQSQVICWLHLKSTGLCEVPDNRLLRGRIVTRRLQNSTRFCPSAHPCLTAAELWKAALCSEEAIRIPTGWLKRWKSLLRRPPPSLLTDCQGWGQKTDTLTKRNVWNEQTNWNVKLYSWRHQPRENTDRWLKIRKTHAKMKIKTLLGILFFSPLFFQTIFIDAILSL